MSRPLRIEYPGAYYHAMNRGANRQNIFLDATDYKEFLSLLDNCRALFGLEVHAYALMPNHYHLLLKTPRGNLSRLMRHLDGVYTQRFNRRHKRDGSLLRGRFKAIVVDADSYLLEVARYIHLNPVKAMLARHPKDFPWSSYRYYMNDQGKPSSLVLGELLGSFGNNTDKAIEEFSQFTLAGVDKEIAHFYKSPHLNPVLGKARFIHWIKGQIARRGQRGSFQEIPRHREIINPPTIPQILSMVCQAYEVSPEVLAKRGIRKHWQAKALAIYLCRNLGGWPLSEIATVFGGCRYSAISNTVSRMQRALTKDHELQKRIADIEGALRSGSLEAVSVK